MEGIGKVYLVGGAVRDEIIGVQVQERDWVVIGGSQEAMLKHGFKKVGRSFPVFLHPTTMEEYALARKETRTGPGHTDFKVDFSPETTLEEDLQRRDLTVNSIAKGENGEIIDPYNGVGDIQKKVLKHTSTAFRDDPLRVLRVARFKTTSWGRFFSIDQITYSLLLRMVGGGELRQLSKERIWAETCKALSNQYPVEYFTLILELGGGTLFGIPKSQYNCALPRVNNIEDILVSSEFSLEAKYALIFLGFIHGFKPTNITINSHIWSSIFCPGATFKKLTEWIETIIEKHTIGIKLLLENPRSHKGWLEIPMYDFSNKLDLQLLKDKIDILCAIVGTDHLNSGWSSIKNQLIQHYEAVARIRLDQTELLNIQEGPKRALRLQSKRRQELISRLQSLN